MVHKVLGGVGILLLVVGIAMTTVISIIKEWVNVGMPGVPACQEQPLGKLGLYGAVFDPECTQGDDVNVTIKAAYSNFKYEESGTTEFWPLFPSQVGFGSEFAQIIPEFTTCEEFWAATGENSGYLAFKENLVKPRVEAQFVQVENGTVLNGELVPGLTQNYAQLVATIKGAEVAVDALVGTLWQGTAVGTVQTVLGTVQSKLGAVPLGVLGFLNLLNGMVQSVAAGGFPNPPNDDFNLDIFVPNEVTVFASPVKVLNVFTEDATVLADFKGYLENEGYVVAGLTDGFTYYELLMKLNPEKMAEFANVAAPEGPVRSALNDTTTNTLIVGVFSANLPTCAGTGLDLAALAVKNQAGAILPFTECIYDGAMLVNVTDSTEVATFGINGTFYDAFQKTIAGLTPFATDPTFGPIVGALNLTNNAFFAPCNQAGYGTAAECFALITGAPQDLTAVDPICTLVAQKPCTFVDLVDVLVARLADPEQASSIPLPDDFKPYVQPLAMELRKCQIEGLTLTGCYNKLVGKTPAGDLAYDSTKIPDSPTANFYALCFGGKATGSIDPDATCTNFFEFVSAQATLKVAFLPVYQGCAALSLSRAQCVDLLATVATDDAISSFIDGKTPAERVAECALDEEDAAAISTAQILIPVALAAEGVGLLLAIASVPTNKGVLAIVAGILSIVGCVCALVGLLLVLNAPVYSSVGAPCSDWEPCYESGSAKSMAYVAIAGPLFAGITLIISSCFNKEVDEDQLTSKVDNTY